MAEEKKILIEITLEAGGTYLININKDQDSEDEFYEESVAGVKGRLAAIAENMHQYIPADESKPGEGATATPKPEEKKPDEKKP